jgi:carbamoyltransferase
MIRAFLDERGHPYRELAPGEWAGSIADLVAGQQVVGVLQGRMEFGPRALGNRSILGDARSATMQSVMNLKIKFRESFRPFAPSVLEERIGDVFELDRPSPYMLLVAGVRPERRLAGGEVGAEDDPVARVNRERSDLPAITHVDYSARIQSVSAVTNRRYHDLIQAIEERTGQGVVINTSFNVRGEPIVCTPEDAYRCFMRTEMDYLVLGPFLLAKPDQPEWAQETREAWREEYPLD